MPLSRRDLLRFAAVSPALVGLGVTAASLTSPSASGAPLGVLLDYAAGVIPASDIKAAGAAGAIRYVSDRRPGGSWMLGKPIQLPEARDLHDGGLKIVSCYQYGKESTADWLGGQSAGVQHAKRGLQLHQAAGGPANAPIYASIDDDPSYDQYKQQVAPYLRGWEEVIGRQRTGVYGNSKTIDWALQDGLGSWFWQHNWGSPHGYTHPAAHLHQIEIDKSQRRRCRRRHQQHHDAAIRSVGLTGQWTRPDARLSKLPTAAFSEHLLREIAHGRKKAARHRRWKNEKSNITIR